jgi:hypothetical protein
VSFVVWCVVCGVCGVRSKSLMWQLGLVMCHLALILIIRAVPLAIGWFVQTTRAASTVSNPLDEISADDIIQQPWTLTEKYSAILLQNIIIFAWVALFYVLSFIELTLFYFFEEEDALSLDQLLTQTRAAYGVRGCCGRVRWVYQSVFYVFYLLFIGTFVAYGFLVLVRRRTPHSARWPRLLLDWMCVHFPMLFWCCVM